MKKTYTVKNTIWKYHAEQAAWYFVTLNKKVSEQIKEQAKKKKGWGSIRVEVKTGETLWQTSIFPDKTKGYLLPIKASVRKKENLDEGDTISCIVTILE